ncbi:TolC family protein [Campylobacter sp. 19-13652]|uniref:TolC family protein n=1 Tax=Campylobacter sp. 19-13652 TaxID=2840180 RepID=UPI001C77188B|nr:TolC family protein [Campylobacter sp. 19-13652]BCX79448.1 multidrug transporter [Campylobacter sp. 19-13652]
MRKILAIFSFCGLCFSQELSLFQIIELAQSSNIAKISTLNAEKSELSLLSAKSAYMPNLSLHGGHNHTNAGLIIPKRATQIEARIDFLIYDGGAKEASLNALESLKNSATFSDKQTKNELALNAVKLYFALKSTNEIINAKSAEIDYLSSLSAKLKKLYDVGLAASDELANVSAKHALSIAQMLNLNRKKDEILKELWILTQREFDVSFTQTVAEPNYQSSSPNPKLEALRLKNEAAKSEIDRAKAEFLPSIFLQGGLIWYKRKYESELLNRAFSLPAATMAQYRGAINDDEIFKKRGHYNEIMLGFSWDIFSFGKTNKQVQIARILSEQARLDLEQEKLKNSINLKNLKNDIDSLKSQINAQKEALEVAILANNSSTKRYEAGLISYSDVLLSLARIYEAKSDYALALSELEIKKAEYFYELGESIKDVIR